MSNEVSQIPPIPNALQNKMRVIHEALEIDTQALVPTTKIASKMAEINEHLMVLF